MPTLRGLTRALFAVCKVVGVRDGALALAVPNEAHRAKCLEQLAQAESALAAVVGAPVRISLLIDGAAHDDDAPRPAAAVAPAAPAPTAADEAEEIDLDELTDVPAEQVVSPIDQLTQAFPGSKFVDE